MPVRWLSQWVESWRCTNSQHSKKLCLSFLMSENLKLKKVNKSFVPRPKESRQSVFSVLWIPMHNERFRMFYISVCICTFHIFISRSYLEYFGGYITLRVNLRKSSETTFGLLTTPSEQILSDNKTEDSTNCRLLPA